MAITFADTAFEITEVCGAIRRAPLHSAELRALITTLAAKATEAGLRSEVVEHLDSASDALDEPRTFVQRDYLGFVRRTVSARSHAEAVEECSRLAGIKVSASQVSVE